MCLDSIFPYEMLKDLTEEQDRDFVRSLNEENETLKFEIERKLFFLEDMDSRKSLKEKIE